MSSSSCPKPKIDRLSTIKKVLLSCVSRSYPGNGRLEHARKKPISSTLQYSKFRTDATRATACTVLPARYTMTWLCDQRAGERARLRLLLEGLARVTDTIAAMHARTCDIKNRTSNMLIVCCLERTSVVEDPLCHCLSLVCLKCLMCQCAALLGEDDRADRSRIGLRCKQKEKDPWIPDIPRCVERFR